MSDNRKELNAPVDEFLDGKLPLPVGMDVAMYCQIGNAVISGVGSIEVWICPNCDKTHMKFVFHGIGEMETSIQPKVGELLGRMLQNPQIPQE